MDQIDFLIDRAHRLFDKTSVFEVIDLSTRQEAVKVLREFYGQVDDEKVDRYLEILDRLRKELSSID
jgi:hypothetical protein